MVTTSATRLKRREMVAEVGKMKDWLGSPMTHATHKLVRTAFNLKNRLSSSVTGSLVKWIRWEESRRIDRLREKLLWKFNCLTAFKTSYQNIIDR